MSIYTGKLVRNRNGQLIRRPEDGRVPARYHKKALYRINPSLWPQVKCVTWNGEIMQPFFLDPEDRQLQIQTVFDHHTQTGERIRYYHLRLVPGTYRAAGFLSYNFTSDSAYSLFGIPCARAQYAADTYYWSGEWFELPFLLSVESSGQVYVNGIDCGIYDL